MRNLRNVTGLGKNRAFHTVLPDGTPGTAKTISYANQLIQEGLKNPQVREITLQILSNAGVRGFDDLGEVRALYEFVHQNFFFRDDPVGYQYLQPVTGMLRTKSGNCASLNLILLPTLLGGVGFPTRAITIKSDPSMPEEYSHVYIEAQLKDGSWIPLDVARPDAAFGLAPSSGSYWERAEWPLTGGGFTGGVMNGLRGLRRVRNVRRGLGDAATTQAFLADLPSIESGAAQIVSAANQPGYPSQAQLQAAALANPNLSVTAGGSSTLLFVLGLAVAGGVLVFAMRK